jgi:hypothetical protein
MRVHVDPGRGGLSFGPLPDSIGAVIRSPIIKESPHPFSIRVSRRDLDRVASYFFEDNERMMRIVFTPLGENIVLRGFKLLRPNKRSPARPPWVEYEKVRKTFSQEDTLGMARHFLSFFERSSIYPLATALKIRVSEDLVHSELVSRSEPDPIFYCGFIKEVVGCTDRGWDLVLSATANGKEVNHSFMLPRGRFYGKPPAVKNWVIAKYDYLTAVVSDRDLGRYFVHYSPEQGDKTSS